MILCYLTFIYCSSGLILWNLHKTYVVGTQWERPAEALQLSTHNMFFGWEEIIPELSSNIPP